MTDAKTNTLAPTGARRNLTHIVDASNGSPIEGFAALAECATRLDHIRIVASDDADPLACPGCREMTTGEGMMPDNFVYVQGDEI